jgi:hypothetical protein
MAQPRGTVAILAAAAALLLAAGLGAHGRYAIVDETAFADRAEAALARPDVREEVALRLIARLERDHPELVPGHRLLANAIREIVRAPEFDAEFRVGVARMHAALFDGGDVSLALPETMTRVRAARERRVPALTGRLPAADDAPPVMTLGTGGALERELRRAAPAAGGLAAWWPLALGLGLALLVFAVVRAPGRCGLRGAGLAAAVAGGVAAVGTIGAEFLLLRTFTTRHGDAVVDAIWDSYVTDVRTGGLIAMALGLAVAAASWTARTPS